MTKGSAAETNNCLQAADVTQSWQDIQLNKPQLFTNLFADRTHSQVSQEINRNVVMIYESWLTNYTNEPDRPQLMMRRGQLRLWAAASMISSQVLSDRILRISIYPLCETLSCELPSPQKAIGKGSELLWFEPDPHLRRFGHVPSAFIFIAPAKSHSLRARNSGRTNSLQKERFRRCILYNKESHPHRFQDRGV